jgi:tetratricopeptide (TPR) repeat protein
VSGGEGLALSSSNVTSAKGMVTSEIELGEVFRLGEAASEGDIVREVGDRLAAQWLPVSRFREVQALRRGHCGFNPARAPCCGLVRSQQMTGKLTAALGYYEQALPILREAGNRVGEAATLNNIGLVHDGRGDGQAALSYYEQALLILREVGAGPVRRLP